MPPLELVLYPDPRLRKPSEPVKLSGKCDPGRVNTLSPELFERVRDMFPVMYEAKGIGLAAPQVGWNVRIFVMNVSGEPEDEHVLVNPEICERTGSLLMDEGCLSLPDIRGKFTRPKQVKLRGLTVTGQALREAGSDSSKITLDPVEIEADGLVARCLQHEMDHLDGILIIDKFSPAKKQAIKARLRELEEEFAGGARR